MEFCYYPDIFLLLSSVCSLNSSKFFLSSQLYILKDCLSKFEGSLMAFEKKCPAPRGDNGPLTDFTGEAVVDIFVSTIYLLVSLFLGS